MTPLVLSLFPGIGLLDRGFEDEGFCVVRGPDFLSGGDVRRFHAIPDRFDGVIGGPPCQLFSKLQHFANAKRRPANLIPEFERVVREAAPEWYLMENVPEAPLPAIDGYALHAFVLDHRAVGGQTRRRRRFSFGVRGLEPTILDVATQPFDPAHGVPSVTASDGGPRRTARKVTGGPIVKVPFVRACALQDLPRGFDVPGLTAKAKRSGVGNGVPLRMARAVAKAIRVATGVEAVARSVRAQLESTEARRA